MKKIWFIFSLIPVPFFFHWYEYGQHLKGEDAPFLFTGVLVSTLIIGVLSQSVKLKYFIIVNLLMTGLSVILASYFLEDNGWYAPATRNFAVILVAIVYLIGQLIVRMVVLFARSFGK